MRLTGKIFLLPRKLVIALIRAYQVTLSPDHGIIMRKFHPNGYCRYYPSCSTYGYQVINKYGLIRGIPRLVWRILRCNPWSKGGIDEVE